MRFYANKRVAAIKWRRQGLKGYLASYTDGRQVVKCSPQRQQPEVLLRGHRKHSVPILGSCARKEDSDVRQSTPGTLLPECHL